MRTKVRTAVRPAAVLVVLLFSACGGRGLRDVVEPSTAAATEPAAGATGEAELLRPSESSVAFTEVSQDIPPDPTLESLITPFRNSLEAEMGQVIGEAKGDFEQADPEGALDNLAADALLEGVRSLVGDTVHAAMLNDGGLRVPIWAGAITVGEIFELMPFENSATIVELSGAQFDSLAQQIARFGGEPIAGFTFAIDAASEEAVDIRVGGQPLDPNETYRLATNDYLANGGGGWPALWSPLSREDLPVLIRDILIDYVRRHGTLEPALDGRIRILPYEGGGSPSLGQRRDSS
jgi:2',3'-cyclic-nucleotide 2'-phosphodiesterase (5'-nucleotidase family)